MKRKVMIILLSLLVIMVAGYAALFALDTQNDITLDRPDSVAASIPLIGIQPLSVQIADSLVFKLDTGSDLSCITAADLERLRREGVAIRERGIPIFGRTSSGRFRVSLTRLEIDLPLKYFTAHSPNDSIDKTLSRLSERDNILRNVEFILIDEPGDLSCLGIDLLQKFAVEYLFNDRLIRLHTSRPEGYQDFSGLRVSFWPSHTPMPGKRFYINLDVDHVTDGYFIDTGLRRAAVKLPAERAQHSRRRLGHDSITSNLGTFEAWTDDAWVECGNRAGTQIAYYCDNLEEPFSVNPLNFFTQDMLLDFPNRSIALRPFVALPKRHFLGRENFDPRHHDRDSAGSTHTDSTAKADTTSTK